MTQFVQLSHIPAKLCFTVTCCFSLGDMQIIPGSVSHANWWCNTFKSASCRAFWRCATCLLRCTTEISSLNTWQFSLIFSNRWTSSCLKNTRRMFIVHVRFMWQPALCEFLCDCNRQERDVFFLREPVFLDYCCSARGVEFILLQLSSCWTSWRPASNIKMIVQLLQLLQS